VIDRFLSGFYEDLFNNTCYNNINVNFNDYLLFLYKCFKEKIPHANNMKIHNEQDIPVWYGNCSGYSLSLTNEEGNFASHIQSQKYAISNIVKLIHNKTNVEIIELKNLSKLTNNIKHNVKNKISKLPNGINNLSEMTLSYMKKNRIIISENLLNDEQKRIILDIYKEDICFINKLEEQFPYCF
jgi:hypothetical protein